MFKTSRDFLVAILSWPVSRYGTVCKSLLFLAQVEAVSTGRQRVPGAEVPGPGPGVCPPAGARPQPLPPGLLSVIHCSLTVNYCGDQDHFDPKQRFQNCFSYW